MKGNKIFFPNNNRLNKGYSKAVSPTKSDNVFYRKQFERSLPPIELVEEYENTYPGTFNKLVAMAEKEQLHRHQLESKNLELYKYAIQMGRRTGFALILCMTTLLLALVSGVIASIFAITVFLLLGGGVLLSLKKLSEKKNYDRKHRR